MLANLAKKSPIHCHIFYSRQRDTCEIILAEKLQWTCFMSRLPQCLVWIYTKCWIIYGGQPRKISRRALLKAFQVHIISMKALLKAFQIHIISMRALESEKTALGTLEHGASISLATNQPWQS